jgi:uncharacterized protein YbaP (TraB family)
MKLKDLFHIGFLLTLVFSLLIACSQSNPDPFTEKVKAAAKEASFTGPALWRVADEDTIVYLFGTVHTLRAETRWETPLVLDALKNADAIYFEADTEDAAAQNAITETATRLGLYSDGRTLREVLDEQAEREVEEAATLLGIELQGFDNFKPWFASTALSNIHLESRGFDSRLGVEKIISSQARNLGKPIRYLETGAYQLGLLASVPESEQIGLLVQTAEQIEDEPDFLDHLIRDWSSGDVEALANSIAADEAFGSGEIYNLMLRTRNANWSTLITKLMEDEAGTFFIAVGAAHLAGADSLQNLLASNGLVAKRENPPLN